MQGLFWQTQGTGVRDLVLLHGWGLNSAVWQPLVAELGSQFRLHLVDLPGYGRSQDFPALSLAQMAETLLAHAPEQAIWLGWSLGGLVATQVALQAPQRVSGLITLASSPRFVAEQGWRGIKPAVLADFRQQLATDYAKTVSGFMALQTLGTRSARQDTRWLKEAVLALPAPSTEVLAKGLDLLADTDHRPLLAGLSMPALRIYGRLDALVPQQVVDSVSRYWPQSQAQILTESAHAPFIAQPRDCAALIEAFCSSSQLG